MWSYQALTILKKRELSEGVHHWSADSGADPRVDRGRNRSETYISWLLTCLIWLSLITGFFFHRSVSCHSESDGLIWLEIWSCTIRWKYYMIDSKLGAFLLQFYSSHLCTMLSPFFTPAHHTKMCTKSLLSYYNSWPKWTLCILITKMCTNSLLRLRSWSMKFPTKISWWKQND